MLEFVIFVRLNHVEILGIENARKSKCQIGTSINSISKYACDLTEADL